MGKIRSTFGHYPAEVLAIDPHRIESYGKRQMAQPFFVMTMSLLAQAALHMLRQRIGAPVSGWDPHHFADSVLRGLEGDIRVKHNTIIVTYYNAPNSTLLKKHYEQLPQKLDKEGAPTTVPWLYDFNLDFRFK